jgi:hypothetical protein
VNRAQAVAALLCRLPVPIESAPVPQLEDPQAVAAVQAGIRTEANAAWLDSNADDDRARPVLLAKPTTGWFTVTGDKSVRSRHAIKADLGGNASEVTLRIHEATLSPFRHVKVFNVPGRFGGWPANHGIAPPGLKGQPWCDCPGGIDFTHPDLAMTLRMTATDVGPSRFYNSTDRGHRWEGPFRLPLFGQRGVAARTAAPWPIRS